MHALAESQENWVIEIFVEADKRQSEVLTIQPAAQNEVEFTADEEDLQEI